MELESEKGRGKEVSVKTAQLVQLLTEIGPDIPEIARSLGQFKESVRYRYKEKILSKGFAVQAAVDHEKLGMKRVVLVVAFDKDYELYAQSILTAMSELCYLQSFARTLPEGKYVINLSVPKEFVSLAISLFRNLEDRGMFKSVEVTEFDWFRNPGMKAEFYDFDEGRWDFDFAAHHEDNLEAARFTPSHETKYDSVDLLLIRELQLDANKSLKEISEELKLNYKKLAWHHNTHVLGRNLLRGYRINWMGTPYDYKFDRALHRKHKYIPEIMIIRDLDELTLTHVRQRICQLPFIWAEAGGRNYYVEFAFPVDSLTESLQYVADAISEVKDRVEMLAIDQTNAIGFTIAPRLFSEESRRWMFNQEEIGGRFKNLAEEIKKESG